MNLTLLSLSKLRVIWLFLVSWARNLTAVLKCLQQIRKMSTYNFRHADPAVTEVQNALHLAESSGAAPELIEKLKSALDLVKLRDDFALAATSKESTKLREIFEETHRHDWAAVHKQGKLSRTLSPWMCSGHLEGKNFFFLSCVWCSVYDSMAKCWKLPQLFFFLYLVLCVQQHAKCYKSLWFHDPGNEISYTCGENMTNLKCKLIVRLWCVKS